MKVFIFLLSALFISCSNAQKISKEQQEIDKKLNHTITELISKKTYPDGHIDLVELNDKNKDSIYNVAYRLLKENHTFKQYGLYGNVARIGLELLTKMKKYKEIDSLLEQNIFFNDFEKRTMKNTYRYLLYRKDNLKKAQSFERNGGGTSTKDKNRRYFFNKIIRRNNGKGLSTNRNIQYIYTSKNNVIWKNSSLKNH